MEAKELENLGWRREAPTRPTWGNLEVEICLERKAQAASTLYTQRKVSTSNSSPSKKWADTATMPPAILSRVNLGSKDLLFLEIHYLIKHRLCP